MDEWAGRIFSEMSWPFLGLCIAISIALLSRAADRLVEEAVRLARDMKISTMLIGATIVSLGTTTPEAVVSVLSAVQGVPGLALGNAVGSVICDTGLILGLACVIGRVPLPGVHLNRQGYMQLGAGVLLVLACLPWAFDFSAFRTGGRLTQETGFLFLLLLGVYLWDSVRKGRISIAEGVVENDEKDEDETSVGWPGTVGKLVAAIAVVVLSSKLLIYGATETAVRAHVPEGVIAATLVAFGTSLPELVTAIKSVRKNHGELALGNVIGADILNVLFVTGAAAAVTPGGLVTEPYFFQILFPAMLTVLLVFRAGIHLSAVTLNRSFGLILLGVYVILTAFSYRYL